MDPFSLKGKVALVTGAGGLLGTEHVIALSEAGASVAACDIDYDKAAKAIYNITTPGMAFQMDISSKDSIKNAFEKILHIFGTVDILVNNAAIDDKFCSNSEAIKMTAFENYPLEWWQRSLDVNLTGMFLCSQTIGSHMAQKGYGSIINIASTYGVVAPDQRLYCDERGKQLFYKSPVYPTTKGAVIAFTRYLAAYWGQRGVRVNCLSPGGVENGQDDTFVGCYSARTILNRMARPHEYRGAIVFLASDASSYMTGANLIVDGGWTAI